MMNPYGHPWFIHRHRFDRHLQQAARDAGSMWLETKARAVEIDERGVSIATADNARVSAQWIIFASGSPSWPARVTHQSPLVADSLIAFWSYLATSSVDRSLSIEATENGWWYFCPGENERTLACFITEAAALRAHKLPRANVWKNLFSTTVVAPLRKRNS